MTSRWKGAAEATAATPRLHQQGVYLITGGLGGIAGVLAEWLAREYRARLVLVGRTPLPQREDWDEWLARKGADDTISRGIARVRQLEALGAQVLPLSADVAVAERMQEVVEEVRTAFGAVHGVFHTAGVIRDNLIQLKSQRDIEDVFSAKLWGSLVLDQVFADTALDFLVLFSSSSSWIAPPGQVDYVGANAFLNALADARRGARRFPVIALNWGVWKDVGMVGGPAAGETNPPELDPAHTVPHDVGYPLFERHLSSRVGVEVVHAFEGTLSASRDWVIDEHRLANGEALLPGTGYLELIRAALAAIGTPAGWQIGNLLFENPLFVPDGEPRGFRVTLRGDGKRWDVVIQAQAAAAAGEAGVWQRCASARVVPAPVPQAPTLDLGRLDADCGSGRQSAGGSGFLRSRQEDHLHFGPRFRPLKRLAFGEGQALAWLELPDGAAGDLDAFALHPGLLDIATGCAMDLIPGYAEQEVTQNLWAPMLYRALRFHAPLQPRVASWIRLSGSSDPAGGVVAFDVVVTDPAGRTLVEVDQLTLRRIEGTLAAPTPAAAKETTAEGAPAIERSKSVSPAELALRHNVSQGIDAAGGIRGLEAVLAARQPPPTVVVSSMDLGALTRQVDALGRARGGDPEAKFTRPQLDNDFEAPRDELETQLTGLFGKLLGVEGVGIRDSFFDLGGHSLIAVRLFNAIGDSYGVDLPMSVLMQSPSVAGLADLLRAQSPQLASLEGSGAAAGEPARAPALRYRYLVPMHSTAVPDRTPIFIVSGMFGNVLNLSHLAHLIGDERPFYAVQARGLYGDLEPHESFEEMARDYLEEIRQVQPKGPYLLGGFSGGGVTAFEMARQLISAGETVGMVVMLDTPFPEFPEFGVLDKLQMLGQDIRRHGIGYLKVRLRERLNWQRRNRAPAGEGVNGDASDKAQFQSRKIGDAFIRALRAYRAERLAINVVLFRPKLAVRYLLSGGRMLSKDREPLYQDNGWKPYVRNLEVLEVPGNHDSMVLEPNVRVLASLIQRSVAMTESRDPNP